MRIRGMALAAVAALSLAGCGSSGSATTTTTAAPVAAASASTTSVSSGPAKFGDTLSKDGYSVTVGAPAAFTPSATAAGSNGMGAGPSSVFQVTVKNGSAKVLNPFGVFLKATSGDAQVGKVFDSGQGIEDPTADILPGKSLTWRVVFEAPPSKPLDVQASVNFVNLGVFSSGS